MWELDTVVEYKYKPALSTLTIVQVSDFKSIFVVRCLHHVPQDDGLFNEILCYITAKSTWNMMNVLIFELK